MRAVLSTPNLLPFYRLGVVIGLSLLIHYQARWFEQQRGSTISVRQARKFFPTATRVQLRDVERGLHYITDSHGDTLGLLLNTSPQTDNIIGYSGPNDVLIALDTNGAIAGLQLERSGDTEDHVDLIMRDPEFLRAFLAWRPNESPPPKIHGVAGATLTSYAIAEAIQQRLAGAAPSLRFTEPLKLDEVRALFTNATRIVPDKQRFLVFAQNEFVGYVLRTSPQADNVAGYRGPTEALVAVAPDARTVTAVRVRSSFDTPSYVDQIRDDDYYLKLFQGRTLDELATLDFKKEKIEGVSGATQTSFAIAEGLKRRAAAELKSRVRASDWRPATRDWGLAGVVAGSLLMAFTPLRGKRSVRVTWQLLLIVYVGIVNSDLLSLSLFAGWATNGLALKSAPGLVLLAAAALLVPLFSRRQLYCHQICPHGAAQELLGTWRRRRIGARTVTSARDEASSAEATVRAPLLRWFTLLPVVLVVFALLVLLSGWRFDLANIEGFDAWSWRAAGIATIVIATIGLIASIFVPQAYCRFGCPTGAILNFIRSAGRGDRWGPRDSVALFLVIIAVAAVAITHAVPRREAVPAVVTFQGRTMGTMWSVKIRDEVADARALELAISNKLEWCEQMTSHWRTNTELSQFNRVRDTNGMFVPWPVISLARKSAEISRASEGAFDITVGPLVQLWGFGPPPRRTDPPGNGEIAALQPAVGWQKIEFLDGQLRKQHPALGIDLSAIAPGWAVDQVAELLEFRGYTNFLVESGGELRARGVWTIAIEHPSRSCTLSNESIGTSGTYRQNYKSGAREYSHLLDPRTGRPVAHNTVSVSVRHARCADADAWAAALNVMGVEAGLALAQKRNLAAQFVVQPEAGRLEILTSSAWSNGSSATPRPSE